MGEESYLESSFKLIQLFAHRAYSIKAEDERNDVEELYNDLAKTELFSELLISSFFKTFFKSSASLESISISFMVMFNFRLAKDVASSFKSNFQHTQN